jgi:hypothetical protein
MLTYPNPAEELSHVAYLLGQAGRHLDRIAKNDPALWAMFEGRLSEAGVEKIEMIAKECDLIAATQALAACGHTPRELGHTPREFALRFAES